MPGSGGRHDGVMREETYAIEARGLVKRFGKTTALAGVDLTARGGTVLGLLGPNGAGKTTAVRILATLLRPDGGEARVCGYSVEHDAYQVRQLIGLTGQYASVDEGLSGTNNLIMIGRLLGLSRADARARAAELLERFELTDAARRIVKTYSGGMRRRLDLAASLVSRPRVLYLDEPTTGLDPHSRNEVWGMIRGLVADGTTVLLTTQYLDEADHLAHDIAVIDHGEVIATGTPDELKAGAGRQVLEVTPADRADVSAVAAVLSARLSGDPATSAESGRVTIQVDDGRQMPEIVRELDDRGIELAEFTLRKASLDEVFLALTGHTAEDTTPAAAAGKAASGAASKECPMTVMSLVPARRLGPVTALRNSFTLTWRSVLKLRTNPEDLFGLLLQPIMYLILFTYVFGGSLAGSTHGYLQFSLPGILVLSVVFATLGTGMMLSQDVATGVFDRFRALPIARWAPLAGAILGDMVRYLISVAVTLGFGMILGFRITTSPLDAALGCLLVILFALAMCWFSAMIGMLVKSAQGVQLWGFLLMFPLVFGSNILTS